MNRTHISSNRTSIGTVFYIFTHLLKIYMEVINMFAFLAISILLFSSAIYLANHFLHMVLFQGEISLFIVGILPLLGVIFAIWTNGFIKFIGIFGNLCIFVIATLIPLYLFFF